MILLVARWQLRLRHPSADNGLCLSSSAMQRASFSDLDAIDFDTQVYIGNIDFEVELKKIENLVRKYGDVCDIVLKQGELHPHFHAASRPSSSMERHTCQRCLLPCQMHALSALSLTPLPAAASDSNGSAARLVVRRGTDFRRSDIQSFSFHVLAHGAGKATLPHPACVCKTAMHSARVRQAARDQAVRRF